MISDGREMPKNIFQKLKQMILYPGSGSKIHDADWL